MKTDFVQFSTTIRCSLWASVKVLLGWQARIFARVEVEITPDGLKVLSTLTAIENIPPMWWRCVAAVFGPIIKAPR